MSPKLTIENADPATRAALKKIAAKEEEHKRDAEDERYITFKGWNNKPKEDNPKTQMSSKPTVRDAVHVQDARSTPFGDGGGQIMQLHVNLEAMKLFNPSTEEDFNKLRDELIPALTNNSHKAPSLTFTADLVEGLCTPYAEWEITKVVERLEQLVELRRQELKARHEASVKTATASPVNVDALDKHRHIMSSGKWKTRLLHPDDSVNDYNSAG